MADEKTLFDPSLRTLKDITLLTEAPPDIVSRLEKSAEWLEFGADKIVVDLKDESTNVFFVVKGKLKALDFLAEG